jgi:hypothetical protein
MAPAMKKIPAPTPERMRVKPSGPGVKIALPGKPRQFMPPEGLEVPVDQHWTRQLKRRDVVLADARSPARVEGKSSRKKASPTNPPEVETR